MKKSLMVFLFSCATAFAYATECVERIYIEEKVNVSLCQNYSGYCETTSLLIKARTKALNEFIIEEIRKGFLKDKKFEITIIDQVMSYKHLELTQSSKAYYINLSGYPSLSQLMTYVLSFSKPNWKPFLTSSYETGLKERHGQIDGFFKSQRLSDTGFLRANDIDIWVVKGLSLRYSGDSLHYFLGDKSLPFGTNTNLPVSIKNRFLFFEEKKILVLEGGKIIKEFTLNTDALAGYDIYSSADWVNICLGTEKDWVLSYSYKTNKFFRNPQENK